MKICICDVCRYKESKITESDYKISVKRKAVNGMVQRIALDVCKRHSNTFRELNSFDKSKQFFEDLYSGGKQMPIGTILKSATFKVEA